jgi:hypothetical protein
MGDMVQLWSLLILAISALRALIVLHQIEEKRLSVVPADAPTLKVKTQARFELRDWSEQNTRTSKTCVVGVRSKYNRS